MSKGPNNRFWLGIFSSPRFCMVLNRTSRALSFPSHDLCCTYIKEFLLLDRSEINGDRSAAFGFPNCVKC